jgi:uncharacterized protein YegL
MVSALVGMALVGLQCKPRDESIAFDEKKCGSVNQPRPPSPSVETGSQLSGSALRQTDGSVRVILNPIVSTSGSLTMDLTSADVGMAVNGKTSASFELKAVAQASPVPVDMVFVIDTTGSMFWAIDGVVAGIQGFVNLMKSFNMDVKIGGIEFGDEIRSRSELADIDTFKVWLDKLGVISGADAPESPLDAMLDSYKKMSFRKGAQRYFILITDAGFHERTDDSKCSDTTLKEVADAMRGRVFFGLVSAANSSSAGVNPSEITRALGGMTVPVKASVVLSGFNVSVDTPLDDAMQATHVITIPASDVETGAKDVTVTHQGSTVTIPIEQLPVIIDQNGILPTPEDVFGLEQIGSA